MSPRVPLTTIQGLTIQALAGLVNGRKIVVWGCGFLGRTIKRSLDRNGLPVTAYCDANPSLQTTVVDGVTVLSLENALQSAFEKKLFLIIASSFHGQTIEKICLEAGLRKEIDFIGYRLLSRPEAAINISGASKPLAQTATIPAPEGYMPVAVYEKVLAKLMREIPLLSCVELSPWDDPLLNPDVGEIVKLTEKSVPCKLLTRLQTVEHLEGAIAAQPSQLAITVNGQEKAYEAYNPGASWQTLVANLRKLKDLLNKHSPKTLVVVLCHRYKEDLPEEAGPLRKLCSELRFTTISDWPYLSSYDAILAACHGHALAASDQQILAHLPWRFERALEVAKQEAHKPCLCQRIFPVIQSDCSVGLCHLYKAPVVADDWLTLPWEEVLQLRHAHEHCGDCQSFGLHRLDIDVLLKQYATHDILFPL
jgi:hypothetical protein